MNLKTIFVKRQLLLCAVALLLSGIVNSNAKAQGLNFNLGQATVDISSETGIISTSFTVALENPTGRPLNISGYSLFLDIGPGGRELPTGVTFDATNSSNDAVTYIAGNGTQPLAGAGQEPPVATINLTPAAGDLGLGQIQFINGTLAFGASADLLTVNLLVDPATAVAGDYAIVLNPNGQNSVSTVTGVQMFGFTAGTLSIVNTPVLLGDVNRDGVVDFLDIGPFIAVLSSGGFEAEADTNDDGIVNFLDIAPFIALLST